jgi:hypothetical protein
MFNISATISTLRTEEEMTERFEAIEEALKGVHEENPSQ